MKKYIIVASAILSLSCIQAQPKPEKETEKVVSSESDIQYRNRLITHFKNYNNISTLVGVFPSAQTNNSSISMLDRFLPFANELSLPTNSLVSFIPEPNVKSFTQKIKNEVYPYIFVNAEMAVAALEAKYTPIVKRSIPITSVILSKKSAPDNDLSYYNTKKIAVVSQAMVTTIAEYVFKQKNINPNLLSAGNSSIDELVLGLNSGLVDGVIVREEIAKGLIKKNPDFKISNVLESVPGFILMARKDSAAETNLKIKNHLIGLDKNKHSALLKGLDASKQNAPFIDANADEIAKVATMLKK